MPVLWHAGSGGEYSFDHHVLWAELLRWLRASQATAEGRAANRLGITGGGVRHPSRAETQSEGGLTRNRRRAMTKTTTKQPKAKPTPKPVARKGKWQSRKAKVPIRDPKKPTRKRATRPTDAGDEQPPAKRRTRSADAYAAHRDRAAKRARTQSAGQRELGPLPAVADPQRRAACESDLQLALETYFPEVFHLGWSYQHIEAIDSLSQSLRHGGLFALGMPRGSGKTSLCIHAGLLAMLFGWRRFLVLIGATASAAYEMLEVAKVQLETNEMLLQDFPAVCYPIRAIEGISQRAKGQTLNGEPTRIQWGGSKEIVLPTVAGSAASSGIIRAVGLLGRIRGMMFVTPDGDALRPDAFLGDDLQTDQSAKNPAQVERRELLVNGAVLGLAGPDKSISGLATVTIVRKGDLADRLLDRAVNPHWHGRTYSLVERWSDGQEMWEHYAELRETDLRAGKDQLPAATKYYRANRSAMDVGSQVPWEQRRLPWELSALQHAYNLRLARPATFDAEYQNAPLLANTLIGTVACPDSDSLVTRTNGYKRNEIAQAASHLFAAIDVQQDVLFYVTLALADDFTGWIVDYGAWPEQPLGHYWTLRQVKQSLKMTTGIADLEGSLDAGLTKLAAWLASRTYHRDDGATMSIDKFIVDANWGPSTTTVYSWCRQSPLHPLPFHGKGISAKQQPMAARKKKPGERAGELWYMPAVRGTNTPRHVIADTNGVKTLLAQRWTTPLGSRGAWSLFQNSIAGHRMFADQISAEYPIETEGRGRKLYEWQVLPGRDNHWLDCCVMAGTLGLMAGAGPIQRLEVQATRQATQSLTELRAQALARRRQSGRRA